MKGGVGGVYWGGDIQGGKKKKGGGTTNITRS